MKRTVDNDPTPLSFFELRGASVCAQYTLPRLNGKNRIRGYYINVTPTAVQTVQIARPSDIQTVNEHPHIRKSEVVVSNTRKAYGKPEVRLNNARIPAPGNTPPSNPNDQHIKKGSV